jgi:UDP-N-acetylmuramate-alanine ligase
VHDGDVVIVMGAGSIGGVAPQLVERLSGAAPEARA